MLFWSIFGHFCEKQTSVQTSEKLAFIPSYTAIFLDVWLYLPYPYRHIRQYFSMFGSTFHIHTVIYGNISRCLVQPSISIPSLIRQYFSMFGYTFHIHTVIQQYFSMFGYTFHIHTVIQQYFSMFGYTSHIHTVIQQYFLMFGSTFHRLQG